MPITIEELKGRGGTDKNLTRKYLVSGTADEADKADMTAAVAAALEQRPAEDTRHLAEQQERRDRIRAIEEIAAQAMHDIEDLTVDTIGSWKAPDFSGV